MMNLSFIGVIPWREAMNSKFIAADFMERIYGPWAGATITVMIIWTAFASIFALLVGYSRIPYAAARDGFFFRVFGKLHPTGHFPYISVLVLGLITLMASFLDLLDVITYLITARILIQFLGQIIAVTMLRRRQAGYFPLFRMLWYPLPSVISLTGWLYIFFTSGMKYVAGGLGLIATGFLSFLLWRKLVASGPVLRGNFPSN
jgi:amino acid transporter